MFIKIIFNETEVDLNKFDKIIDELELSFAFTRTQ
jgi:hypothetical protein